MVVYSFKRCFILTLFLLALFWEHSDAFAQQNVDFLDLELKTKDKKELTKSIAILIENMRGEKWGKVYDLLLKDPVEGRTKEEFIQQMNEDSMNPSLNRKVVGFSPKSYFVLNNKKNTEKVHISGCIKVLDKGRKYSYWGVVDAQRASTEKWFFTSLPIISPNLGSGGPKNCTN